jgi:hypothetical protein
MRKLTLALSLFLTLSLLSACDRTESNTSQTTTLTSLCGDFPISNGDGGPTSRYFVCGDLETQNCYYKVSAYELKEGAEVNTDLPYGKDEGYSSVTTFYGSDGKQLALTESQSLALSCEQTTQDHFESKVSDSETSYLAETPEKVCGYEDLELPVVVFTISGIVPDEVKQQILDRVVNPFVDYEAEQRQTYNGSRILLTVRVRAAKDDFEFNESGFRTPYLFDFIFSDGVNGGSVINEDENGIKYWTPTCLGDCEFSDDYRKKYPEVVNEY